MADGAGQASAPKCAAVNCGRSRERWSAFCGEHHRAAMQAVSGPPGEVLQPAELERRRIARYEQAHEVGAITTEELGSQLLDHFVHLLMQGLDDVFAAGVKSLQPSSLVSLHQQLAASPEPRMFQPLPSPGAKMDEQRRRAVAARDRIAEVTGERLLALGRGV